MNDCRLFNYKALRNELEIHVNLRDNFEMILKYWTKEMNKGCPRELKPQNYSNLDMPRGSSNDMSFDRIVEKVHEYKVLLEEENMIVSEITSKINRINELIKDSDNIYNKVAYLKYQTDEYGRKKYTLEQIAEMLVYSVDRIKQISAQV